MISVKYNIICTIASIANAAGCPRFSTPCLFQSFLNRILDERYSKSALDAKDLCLVPIPDLPRRKRVALKKPESF